MTRQIERVWRPLAAVLFGIALAYSTIANQQLADTVRQNKTELSVLRQQVKDLGGDPDAPLVVNVLPPGRAPESPQPASPTMREPRVVVVPQPPPPSPQRTTARPRESRTPPTRPPPPSSPAPTTPPPSCGPVDRLLGRCP